MTKHLLSLAVVAAIYQPALAENTNPDTVVVTGIKDKPAVTATTGNSALPIMETPVSVQVISQDIINSQKATSLEQVLRNVSGVQPMFYIGGGYERFIVRGFEQSMATYRNGVQLPFLRFQAANTERVEVLKGPAAAEYGLADPGGVINVVTKSPNANEAYNLSQSFGSYNDYRTELGATGALDKEGDVLYRVDAAAVNAGGYRELTDTESYFIAPSVRWKISPQTQLDINLELDKATQLYDTAHPAVGSGIADLPVERSFNQQGLFDRYSNRLLDVKLTHQFNDHWSLAAGFTDFANNKDYRSFYAWSNLKEGDTQADRMAWFGPEDFDTRSSWLHLKGDFATGGVKHHLLVGAQYSRMDGVAVATDEYVDTIDIYTYRPAQSHADLAVYDALVRTLVNSKPFERNGKVVNGYVSDQQDSDKGIFIQDQMEVTEQLNVQAALRYDTINRSLDTAYYTELEPHYERDDSKTSSRLGVSYKWTPSFTTYANYSTSFGPSFSYEPSALYDPETAKQYELGAKSSLLNGNLLITAAVFDLTKANIATPDPVSHKMASIGEANSRGVEFDLQGNLSSVLSLNANYAYTDTEITKDGKGNQGKALPNAPKHQAGAWLRYAPTAQLSIGGGPTYASARFGDAANSYSDGSYTRWDLFAAYEFTVQDTKLKTQLNINNLTDVTYYKMRARWTNMPAAPRSVTASVSIAL